VEIGITLSGVAKCKEFGGLARVSSACFVSTIHRQTSGMKNHRTAVFLLTKVVLRAIPINEPTAANYQ
jgi:hypothetical protein